MTQADRIRQYAIDTYVAPARHRGDKAVTIRAGDVAGALKLRNVLPAVCSALGTDLFETQARVRRTACEGPLNGSNLVLTYEVL